MTSSLNLWVNSDTSACCGFWQVIWRTVSWKCEVFPHSWLSWVSTWTGRPDPGRRECRECWGMRLSFHWAKIFRDKHDSFIAEFWRQLLQPLTDSVAMKWNIIINNNQGILKAVKWSADGQHAHRLLEIQNLAACSFPLSQHLCLGRIPRWFVYSGHLGSAGLHGLSCNPMELFRELRLFFPFHKRGN